MRKMTGENDTICAIATSEGKSAVGIVRISGGQAFSIVQPLFMRKGRLVDFNTHTAHYSEIQDPREEEVIDQGLFLVMKGPRSYTGEDTVEIQSHGNPYGLQRILACLVREGARIAGPGEFTRRAFLSGKMDLAQAEAVMEVIASEGDQQYQWALSQLKGSLSHKVGSLRDQLLSLLSGLEASIDFPEEGINGDSRDVLRTGLRTVCEEINTLLAEYEMGRRIREGFTVAIVGRPNVGKSSLMNVLLKEDRAIVTPFPGTTRDLLREWITLDGMTGGLVDTAGYRVTDHPIEREGVLRGEAAEKDADLILWVLDSSESFTKEDQVLNERLKNRKRIVVCNKVDLPTVIDLENIHQDSCLEQTVKASTVTGEGLSHLQRSMKRALMSKENRERPLVALVRHKEVLERVRKGLDRALHSVRDGHSPEFIAIDVRDTINALGEVVGETPTEAILDQIFDRFCIGK